MRASLLVCLSALLPGLASAAGRVDYTRDVKPLLARRCVACHGPAKQRSGLRLDSGAGILKGGDTGPAVVPNKSAGSLLIRAVTGAEGVSAMPPKGPRLSAREVTLLRDWIDAGIPVPVAETAVTPPTRGSSHWAFRPPVRPVEPTFKRQAWVRNPIDAFILASLARKGILPSPEADRVTLVRRVSLDLTGLPPTPEEVDAFLNDKAPDAYERLVDRLLASPQYGERWARHWLDLARYADSNGYSIDSPRSIWKYRDWVIGALNDDMPFDRFTAEQLAGDLLPNATPGQRIATGFHRNTQINEEGGIDQEQFRAEAVIDRTNTTGSVFLGLTVGCAQCHDHKFDPITQREYYQLFAFFNSTDDLNLELATPGQLRRRKELQTTIAGLEKRLGILDTASPAKVEAWEGSLTPPSRAMLPKKVQDILAIAPNGRSARQQAAVVTAYRRAEQVRHAVGGLGGPLSFGALAHAHVLRARLALEKEIEARKKHVPAVTSTLVLRERRQPRTTHVHLGGDFLRKGAVVRPDTPAVLPPLHGKAKPDRLDLARWLVSGSHPLTARVVMNRYWQAYFGAGLVETENDFGTQGTPPSHPELLDWLATEFVRRGWSMKQMHRLIVTSATYRQSGHARPDLAAIDPRNRLLARQGRLRLDAEVVRDVALASSGLLSQTVGGPSVFPPQPPGVYAFTQVPRDWRASTGPDRYRRGLYTYFWRSAPHPALVVFDAPDATSACTRRNRSNTPLQALTLLNDQAFFEYAQGLAARVLREGHSDEERITRAFRLCLARSPRPREVQVLARLLKQQRDAKAPDAQPARAGQGRPAETAELAAWTALARVLLNLDEFITRE